MEDAATRRARLKAIKDEAERLGATEQLDSIAAIDEGENDGNGDVKEPVLKFRNYAVRDEKIEHEKVRLFMDQILQDITSTNHHNVSMLQLEAAKAPEFEEVQVDLHAIIGEDPEEVLANVAPKKANWDLRRVIAPKLAKLDRRTQRAMIQIMQQEEQRRQLGDTL